MGRTGAGKSSLINMLKEEDMLPTGAIGSTTRWLEGVSVDLGPRTVTFVDSPGIGETLTDSDYHNGIKEWFSKNHSQVRCLLLVLQADSKAHADDKRLVDALQLVSRKPLIIALNQVDKIKPIRAGFSCECWEEEQKRSSPKSRNVREKINEVARSGLKNRKGVAFAQYRQPPERLSGIFETASRQFALPADNGLIAPVVAEMGFGFNRMGLVQKIIEESGRR